MNLVNCHQQVFIIGHDYGNVRFTRSGQRHEHIISFPFVVRHHCRPVRTHGSDEMFLEFSVLDQHAFSLVSTILVVLSHSSAVRLAVCTVQHTNQILRRHFQVGQDFRYVAKGVVQSKLPRVGEALFTCGIQFVITVVLVFADQQVGPQVRTGV